MATLEDLIDSIARRVRDESNTAHSRNFIREIFTRSAAIINSKQEYVFDTVAVSGTANKALFNLEADLGGISRVADVDMEGRSLNEVNPWTNLWKLSPTWLTDTSTTPLAWAAIGRDRVAIWPAPILDVTLTFVGVRGNFQTMSESQETGFRAEDDDIVRELATALLLLRQRDLDMVQVVISRMAGKANLQKAELEGAER